LAGPSFIATCLENKMKGTKEEQEEMEEAIKDVASIFFAGEFSENYNILLYLTYVLAGSDTIISVLLTFMLMVIIHQDAQKKAQEELDRVVGRDRLPDFSDLPHLPYLGALVRESIRYDFLLFYLPANCNLTASNESWHPPAPLGLH
jgi:cytochrome P450